MMAKLFHSCSSCGTSGLQSMIMSFMMVFFSVLSYCDAMSSSAIPFGNAARLGEMTIHEDARGRILASEKPMCVYTITTETGKKWGAGTDSKISLRLYNNASQGVVFPNLDNAKNNFERGKVDKFQEPGDCVDHICKMVLFTDNSGFMPAWFVNSIGVSVTTPKYGFQIFTWQLHEWLPKDDSSAAFFDLRDDCFSL